MRTVLVTLALCLLLPSTAAATTAWVEDPVDDVGYSFGQVTDIQRVQVVWDQALTVSVTYRGQPRSLAMDLLSSAASRDEHDTAVEECDPDMADSLTVQARDGAATLTVPYIEGSLTVPAQVAGPVVSYRFESPALTRAFAPGVRDPFACVDGSADGDEFYGAFDGKTLKLTPSTVAAAMRAELRRRYNPTGALFVDCPRSYIAEATGPDDEPANMAARSLCAFQVPRGRTYRMGYASVFLAAGVPQFTDWSSRSFATSLRFCGTAAYGRRMVWRRGLGEGGASVSAWAQRTSCRTARRVAVRWRGRGRVMGFRCKTTSSAHEFIAVRCTRGQRVVRFESGA